jgi:hypothetical protein
MVTDVLPAVGPIIGEIPLTVGMPIYENWSADDVAEVPPGVVTVTSMVPAAWPGLVTVICVTPLTVIAPVAFAVPPNLTVLAPVRLVPVTVTDVPPAAEPNIGEIPVTVGIP